MIPLTQKALHDQSWQWHLKNSVTTIKDLATKLDIEISDVPTDFPLLVPLPYLKRISPGNPSDPLLLQILPTAIENESSQGFFKDPLREISSTKGSGMIHKYYGRLLIIATGICAVNCRYCFRRHFPYNEHQLSKDDWRDIENYIKGDPSIKEVILSGGDPLMMTDKRLKELVLRLGELGQLTHLRIHTRLPIVIPQRVTSGLLDWAGNDRFRTVFVIHANHANEIDGYVGDAIEKLRSVNISVLNQSVLLKGVNNKLETLIDLSWQLSKYGVLPYYLHLLDKVSGSVQFDIPEKVAVGLVKQMTAKLPGYLVPKLVREIPDASAKVQIGA